MDSEAYYKGERLSAGGSYTVAVIVPAAGYEIQNILAEKEGSSVLWELALKREGDTKLS